MAETSSRTVTIAKQRFQLRRDRVERATRRVLPEPISSHYVVVCGRRYPPKQVISLVTGLDRADFTSHQARRVLMGLGFAAGRRPLEGSLEQNGSEASLDARSTRARSKSRGSIARPRPTAETLEPFVGQWIATDGPEVLVAAEDPRTVVSWLAEHGKRASSMFRVPDGEFQASGLAPL
jgi:hypothetical protein